MLTEPRSSGSGGGKPNVALFGQFAAAHAHLFRERLTVPANVAVLPPETLPGDILQGVAQADVLVTAVWPADAPAAPNLKFMQVCTTGLDRITMHAVPPHTIVSNVYGHEGAVAEYAVMGMLMFAHRVQEQMRYFRANDWRFSGYAGGEPHGEFAGSRVTIVGLGHIGCGVAERSTSLGATVTGVSRSMRSTPLLHRWSGIEQLDTVLPETDFLVICCPETPETAGMIDARRIALLPPNAVIINVARGPVVDEAALFSACESKRIAGAVLDVWYQYPSGTTEFAAPSRFPFASLDNVIMTPHSSGWTRQAILKRWDEVAANVDRFLKGEAPANVISWR